MGATLLIAPAAADVTTASVVRDAWYQAPLASDLAPLCTAPTGCNPVANAYGDGTLQVGNLNGGTTEFSVVQFDGGVLPPFAEVTGGTAVLPVLDANEGSFGVDTAAVTTCLVREPFDEVDGAAADQAPHYDCTVRSPAVYDGEAQRFTVDLTPFAEAWSAGGVSALVLLPDSADVGNWHVALAGREAADDTAPRAELLWRSPAPADTDGSATAGDSPPVSSDGKTPAPTPAPTSEGIGITSPQSPSPPVGTAPRGPVVAVPDGDVGPPHDTLEQPIVTAAEPVAIPYPYKAAWLLPLVLLIAGFGLTRSLNQEVVVIATDAPQGLRARLWLALWPEE